eukprot:scpid97197/ scgid10552/ Molybdopterin synthase sulfur carrier subunit; Molybdenum cofactor synthesis protein 2 small subunit; Molybdenum cofactor synthesis protein 2A; Protein viviparous15; Sulfur carrier protein MOCS2A
MEAQSADHDVQVSVLLFAKARELCGGVSTHAVHLPASTTFKHLKSLLLTKFPQLTSIMATCVLALNAEYLSQDDGDSEESDQAAVDDIIHLRTGDELAVIPPISGG